MLIAQDGRGQPEGWREELHKEYQGQSIKRFFQCWGTHNGYKRNVAIYRKMGYHEQDAWAKAPAGIMAAHEQLALLTLLEELAKSLPADSQHANSIGVVTTLLLGPRIVAALTAGHTAKQ